MTDLITELRQGETFLTTQQVMVLLKMTRNTVCQYVRIGRLSAIRVGNSYLYDPRVLAEWLAERETRKRSARVA